MYFNGILKYYLYFFSYFFSQILFNFFHFIFNNLVESDISLILPKEYLKL